MTVLHTVDEISAPEKAQKARNTPAPRPLIPLSSHLAMSLLRTVCLCLAFSSGSALKLGAATSRRAIMQKAAAVVPLAVAAPAFASLTPAEAAGRSFADGQKKVNRLTCCRFTRISRPPMLCDRIVTGVLQL